MKVNKYGLPRKIDFSTKRILRQECGYGCVICGNAIYQYEHIDPEYSEAKIHDPRAMALLCGACHDKVTRGIWSKRKVKEARINPICKKRGFSNFELDTKTSNDFIIKIGKTSFLNLESIIEIDDKIILSILPPEEFNAPPRISAIFFDRNNNKIACIDENEWFGFTSTFDIETKSNSIVIRSNDRKIDLIVKLESPDLLILEKIEMIYNNVRISGSYNSDFKVYTNNSGLKIPQTKTQIKNAPFWLSVKGNKISLGSESIIKFTNLNGEEVNLPGYYDIENLGLELVFTCINNLNIVDSVLFLTKGVCNGKKSTNTLLLRE